MFHQNTSNLMCLSKISNIKPTLILDLLLCLVDKYFFKIILNFKFSRIPISEFKKTKFKTDLEKKTPKQIVSQRVPV